MTIPITYVKNFVPDADTCFNRLSKELTWVHRDTTPRHEYYVNDFGVPYTYGSGDFARTYEAQPAHDIISLIRSKLENETKEKFEVCFLNRYLNQSDHLGWHSDNSPEMDDNRPIAIISFGVEREIWFRSMEEPKVVSKMKLENGSLCLMRPGMQDTHQHRIPKASFMCGERISLTFRGYVKDLK